MILKNELRKIAWTRLKDAEILCKNERYDGALYLCGYAVEAVLKARICRTLKWDSFPSTRGEFQAYQSFKTHDLDVLLSLSGVESKILTGYPTEWANVSKWSPEMRYSPIGSAKQSDVLKMIEAAKVRTPLLRKEVGESVMIVRDMMVRKVLQKLISTEKEIASERGNFALFGLFLREGAHLKRWDLVISADWQDTSLESQRAFIKWIQSRLERDEFLSLAMVLILELSHPFVEKMNSEFDVEHGDIEFTDYVFNGMAFERAHIITSKGRKSG